MLEPRLYRAAESNLRRQEKQLADIKTQQEMDERRAKNKLRKERRNATIAGFELKEGTCSAAPVVNRTNEELPHFLLIGRKIHSGYD